MTIHNTLNAPTAGTASAIETVEASVGTTSEAGKLVSVKKHLGNRLRALAGEESGMSTVEYALGTIAAAAFGALLYTVVTGGEISDALTNIIERALNTNV